MSLYPLTGRYSTVELPGNGSQTNFDFSFDGGYISQAYVFVTTISATGVETVTPFVWVSANTIQVTPAPANNTTLRIRRLTPITATLVNFSTGAAINEANLDKVVNQAVHAAADAADTGLIAAAEVRKDATDFKLWTPAVLANYMVDALPPLFPVAFKGDTGGIGPTSTVPGPVGPAPVLTIGNTVTVAAGGAATAALRANGVGAYYVDLGIPIGATGSGASVSWGGITGTLSNQPDLVSALAGKSDTTHTHTFASLTAKPTTVGGYGITDALTTAYAPTYASVTGKPTTFAPSAHSHVWGDITTGKPTTLAGYGITNGAKLATISTAAPTGGVAGDVWYKV